MILSTMLKSQLLSALMELHLEVVANYHYFATLLFAHRMPDLGSLS